VSLYEFEGKRPQIAESAFVHPEAILVGGVNIGEGCYIGPGAVLRADWGNINLGDDSNIQENCTIHAAPDSVAEMGPESHICHGAIIHGSKLGKHVMVGLGAILNEKVVIGDGCIIGEACFVPRGMIVPSHKVVVGIPARILGDMTKEKDDYSKWATRIYQELPARCHSGLKRID